MCSFFFYGCSFFNDTSKDDNALNADTLNKKDSLLCDQFFKLKNIKNTLNLDKIDFKKGNFLSLTTFQRHILTDSISPNKLYSAYFVSIQNKIGDIQPVIISISTDDYDALVLINLNKNNKITSTFELNNGFCAGPSSIDTITYFCPIKYSFIDKSEIKTIKIKYSTKDINTIDKAIVDSIVYLSKIQLDGKIKTTQLDSVRFIRNRPYWIDKKR